MSILQRTLAQKRKPDSSPGASVSTQPIAQSIVIHSWQGELWVLPWSHFDGAHFSERDGIEKFELKFTHNLVVLIGRNLRGLVADVAAFQLACLREMPEDYRPSAEDCAPFISRIEIGSLSKRPDPAKSES